MSPRSSVSSLSRAACLANNGLPTYRRPSNARRAVRAVRDHVGLARMTHTWRRTYATLLDQEMTLTDRAKADLLRQAKLLQLLKII